MSPPPTLPKRASFVRKAPLGSFVVICVARLVVGDGIESIPRRASRGPRRGVRQERRGGLEGKALFSLIRKASSVVKKDVLSCALGESEG
jgi:hypothetical protein